MSYHTPGPWFVGTDTARGARPGRVHILVRLSGAITSHVAVAEYQCDAPLIAAAPDLLAIAQRYASECAECNGTGETIALDIYLECADIRAVIAKAVLP